MTKYLYIFAFLIAGYSLAGQIGMSLTALMIVMITALIPNPA